MRNRWCARSTAGPGDQPGRAGKLLLAAYRLRRQVIEARVQDYLSRYDVPAREALDVRWALTCMELEDEVERLEAVLSPVLLRRAQAKLCRHCITTTTTHSPGCPSWKPTCTV